MLFYRAALPLSRQTLTRVARIIRRHRAAIGSLWRKLNPGSRPCPCSPTSAKTRSRRPPRDSASAPPPPGDTSTRPWRCWPAGRRSYAGRCATPGRRIRLRRDRRDPDLDRQDRRRPSVLLRQGPQARMNLQFIASPVGDVLSVSGPLPGAVHDLTAARIWGTFQELAAAGLCTLADKGPWGRPGRAVRTN